MKVKNIYIWIYESSIITYVTFIAEKGFSDYLRNFSSFTVIRGKKSKILNTKNINNLRLIIYHILIMYIHQSHLTSVVFHRYRFIHQNQTIDRNSTNNRYDIHFFNCTELNNKLYRSGIIPLLNRTTRQSKMAGTRPHCPPQNRTLDHTKSIKAHNKRDHKKKDDAKMISNGCRLAKGVKVTPLGERSGN